MPISNGKEEITQRQMSRGNDGRGRRIERGKKLTVIAGERILSATIDSQEIDRLDKHRKSLGLASRSELVRYGLGFFCSYLEGKFILADDLDEMLVLITENMAKIASNVEQLTNKVADLEFRLGNLHGT